MLAYAFYIGIGNYGSFISGVQTIREQISSASDFLTKEAFAPYLGQGIATSASKRSGALSGLQRLFTKVQKGEISVEEAMRQSEALLGEDGSGHAKLMESLQESFVDAPRFHRQLSLSLEDEENTPNGKPEKPMKTRKPASPSPNRQDQPATQLFRIELRRESKKTKRTVRVVPIKK